MSEQSAPPIRALREWASAIRGNWGDIDGRTAKTALLNIADAIDGMGSPHPIEWWREDLSLCPNGEGHWTHHCRVDGCGNEPTHR